MAPAMKDFPDARFDAFRRTDMYGPAGRGAIPRREQLRLALAAATLVPLKAVAALTAVVFFYLVCR
jgi:lysophosphatidylcholine acyltransferase/lyso-PAF acetyltransferase